MNKLINIIGTIVIAAGGALLSLQDAGPAANIYGVAVASAMIMAGAGTLVAAYYLSLIKPTKA